MNDLVVSLGIEHWKPVVSSLLLPPLPLLLLILVGARLMYRRRAIGWSLILVGTLSMWLLSTPALGKWMRVSVFPVPMALGADEIEALRRPGTPPTAIVVLGGGRRDLSPEYGVSNLNVIGLERLRYGVWLARQTRLPLAFSGGLSHGARPGLTEAEIAARIAEKEFGLAPKWIEDRSRDTTENGLLSVPLLRAAGVQRIVLVTHDYHMRRAQRAFERAAAREGSPLSILPAPMGLRPRYEWSAIDFLPSRQGWVDSQLMLHEMVGYALGA